MGDKNGARPDSDILLAMPYPTRHWLHMLWTMRFGPRMRLALACMLAMAAMLIAAGLMFIFGAGTGPRTLLLGAVLACAPVPFYVAITLWLDRFEAEPLWMLAACFIWGTTAAALIPIAAYQYFIKAAGHLTPFSPMLAQLDLHMLWVMALAPAVEELAKGCILLLLYSWNRDEFDGVLDGIIYAAMAGLGFAMTENILYYTNALMLHGQQGLTDTVLLRGVIFPFQHPFFTAFLGIGLGMAAVTRRKWARRLAPVIGLALAMTLHVLWNVSTVHRHLFVAGYLLMGVPVMLGVITLICLSLRHEARVISVHLLVDVNTGRLSPLEHHRLSRIRRRMRHDLMSLLHKGPSGLLASLQFHQVATELAFYRHHAGTGRLRFDAWREMLYLKRMAKLRAQAALPDVQPPEYLNFDI